MPKLLDEHKCEDCDDQTWFVRLAEPQAVRVAPNDGKGPRYMAYADYAVIQIHNGTYGKDENQKKFSEVTVWAADEEEETFPGIIYSTNRGMTLDEILWILGGEYDSKRPKGKV